jgi:hypothetical protein
MSTGGDLVVLVMGAQVSRPMNRTDAKEHVEELRTHGLYATIAEYRPQVKEPIKQVEIGNHDTRYDGWQSTRNTSRYGREI